LGWLKDCACTNPCPWSFIARKYRRSYCRLVAKESWRNLNWLSVLKFEGCVTVTLQRSRRFWTRKKSLFLGCNRTSALNRILDRFYQVRSTRNAESGMNRESPAHRAACTPEGIADQGESPTRGNHRRIEQLRRPGGITGASSSSADQGIIGSSLNRLPMEER